MTDTAKGGAVLLHGLGKNAQFMQPFADRLEAAGFRVLTLSYASKSQTMAENVEALATPIITFAASLYGSVHFIGHSLGGLVIRAYLARHRPVNLGRVVMLGTPNHGSEVADFAVAMRLGWAALGKAQPFLTTQRAPEAEAQLGVVDYPLGIIAGNRPSSPPLFAPLFHTLYDGKVSVASTRLEGMADHIVLPVAHDPMPRLAEVQHQALAFLSTGAFDRGATPSN